MKEKLIDMYQRIALFVSIPIFLFVILVFGKLLRDEDEE